MAASKIAGRIAFLVTVLVLVAALVFSAIVIVTKNNKISEMQIKIESSQQQNSDIEKKLEEAESAKQQLETEKQQLEADKKKLEEENGNLKRTIETLKLQRQQQQAALNNAAQNHPQPSPPGDKICYLTFDDGPSPVTLRVLDTLRQYNVKATFFVINNSKYINYLSNIAADGHAIALHSYSHNYSSIYSSVDNFFADLQSISNVVKSITGIESKIMRFPGGGSNAVSKKYCSGIMTTLTQEVQNRGYAYFDWNVSSGDADANRVSKDKIVANVLNGSRNKNSVCVLMHDAGAKTTTADALPEIIVGLQNMGFRFEVLTNQSYGYHQRVNN